MTSDPTTIALRCAGAVLLELPITPSVNSRVWVASIRSAPHTPAGWARQLWRPDTIGWTVPGSCVFGTVIEFGADITTGRRRDRRQVRWYVIAVGHEHDWLICHGPHPTPDIAEQVASEWLRSARAYAVTLHDPTIDHTSDPTRRPALTVDPSQRSRP
jgi:hypothetical protein